MSLIIEHPTDATAFLCSSCGEVCHLVNGDGEGLCCDRSIADAFDERGGITMRGYDRVQRVAWTLVDLDGVKDVWEPTGEHIAIALKLRGVSL